MATGRFKVETEFVAKDKVSRPIAKMQSKFGKLNRKIERGSRRAGRAMAKVGKAVRRVGLIFAATAAAAGAVAFNVIKAGASFEQAITNVGAVGLNTRDQIADLEKQAKELGATTKFTATQAAQAMEILAKAGFKNQEILAATPGVLNAAAASGLEMAEVANVVSNALKGMGLEASTASDVADVLALASARTNSTIGSLGESLKNVAATARTLGVPLTDTVAAVALLQDVGLDATVAGSAMNTMLTKLAKPPAAIAKAMKKAGLSFKKANGDMKKLPEVLDTINKLAEQSGGNLDRVGILADLVGLRGQKAATNLAKLFTDGRVKELTAELEKARGSAESMAEIRMDTLTGDMTKLSSTIEGIKIDIFNNANSDLREIVQNVRKWIVENRNLIVAMGSDPLGFFREGARAVEDIIRNVLKLGNTILFGPIGALAELAGFELPNVLGPSISDAELAAQRQAEDRALFERQSGLQVVPPQEKITTEKEEVDITLRDQTGKAEVKSNRPKSRSRLRTPRSGAFTFSLAEAEG